MFFFFLFRCPLIFFSEPDPQFSAYGYYTSSNVLKNFMFYGAIEDSRDFFIISISSCSLIVRKFFIYCSCILQSKFTHQFLVASSQISKILFLNINKGLHCKPRIKIIVHIFKSGLQRQTLSLNAQLCSLVTWLTSFESHTCGQ